MGFLLIVFGWVLSSVWADGPLTADTVEHRDAIEQRVNWQDVNWQDVNEKGVNGQRNPVGDLDAIGQDVRGQENPIGDRGTLEHRNDVRQMILNRALTSLEQRYDPEEFRFSLKFRWIPGHLTRKEPEQILSVDPEGEVERYTTFEVRYLEEDRKRQVQVQFAVDMEQKLPVAVRRIPSGEVLEDGDLDVRWVSVTNVKNRRVRDTQELEGKYLRRTLAPGEPVRRIDIGGDDLIESGDPVTLIFEKQGVRIELEAEARQNGAKDEEIRIYSSETRKKYLGRIVRPGVALWQQTL